MAVGLIMGIENECSAEKIPTNLRLYVFRTSFFIQIFFVGWGCGPREAGETGETGEVGNPT